MSKMCLSCTLTSMHYHDVGGFFLVQPLLKESINVLNIEHVD